MQTTWIVAADSTRARILEMKGRGQPLQEMEDLYNPAGREQDHELGKGERGRFYGNIGTPGQANTADYSASPVEHANERFAHTVAEYLDRGRNDHRYNKVVIVADPKFLGLLRNNLNKEVKKLVEKDMAYDISTFNERQIADFVENKMGLH